MLHDMRILDRKQNRFHFAAAGFPTAASYGQSALLFVICKELLQMLQPLSAFLQIIVSECRNIYACCFHFPTGNQIYIISVCLIDPRSFIKLAEIEHTDDLIPVIISSDTEHTLLPGFDRPGVRIRNECFFTLSVSSS